MGVKTEEVKVVRFRIILWILLSGTPYAIKVWESVLKCQHIIFIWLKWWHCILCQRVSGFAVANDRQIPEWHLGNQIVLLQFWSKLPWTRASTLTRLPNPCASSELQGRERLGNWFPLYHRILPPVQWEPFNQTKTAVHPSNRPTIRSTWILQKIGLFATPSRSTHNPIDMVIPDTEICLIVSRHFSLQKTGPALSNSQKYWSQEMWGRSRCCSTEHQSVKHWNASKFKRHTVLNWLPGLFKMFSKADLLFSQT